MWARKLIRKAREAGATVVELKAEHIVIAVGAGRWYFANPKRG
jgi:hypothetical protein